MPTNSDFRDLLKIFNDEKVKYLIVGGYAVIEYTEPRYTKDLDIWVQPEKENAAKVYKALEDFGAPLLGIEVEDFVNQELVYQMGIPPSRIDVLMGLKELDFETCWKERVESYYGDVPVNILDLEHLIANKLVVGRPQDMIDAENLRSALQSKSKRRPARHTK